MKMFFLCVAALSVASAGYGAFAQRPCRSTVLVTALDRSTNQAIDGLASADFRAKVKGRDVLIRSVALPPTERRLVFVLDRSASMTSEPEPEDAHFDPNNVMKLLLVDAITALPKGDAVAFLAFAGQHSYKTEFVPQANALGEVSKVLSWKPEGRGQRTPLWENVHSALQMLSPHKMGDVMVVISDGLDNLSDVSEVQVRSELLSAGVTVLAMVVVRQNLKTVAQRDEQQSLFDLVRASGGIAVATGSPASRFDLDIYVPIMPRQMMSQLTHQYELELNTSSIQKPDKWELGLTSTEAEKRVKLFYPRLLQNCSAIP